VDVFDPASTQDLVNTSNCHVVSRHGPHRKHRCSIFALVSAAAETCLPNRFLEMGCITPRCIVACVHIVGVT
jgi:hypothetical protein